MKYDTGFSLYDTAKARRKGWTNKGLEAVTDMFPQSYFENHLSMNVYRKDISVKNGRHTAHENAVHYRINNVKKEWNLQFVHHIQR
jgi:hypothetical protein